LIVIYRVIEVGEVELDIEIIGAFGEIIRVYFSILF